MVIYKCELCNFITKIKTQHKTHVNTKKHQNNENKHGLNIGKNSTKEHKSSRNEHKLSESLWCIYCNKDFKTKANLNRHIKNYCKHIGNKINSNKLETKIKNIENVLCKQQKEHDKEKKFLFKQIELLLNKVGNTTINNTQNIQLNNYGKEDLSHITESFKLDLLSKPYGMIPKLIKEVHFNDTKPENKNIALTNKNDNKIKIFTGSKWIYKNKDETINDLMDGKYFILDTYYENNVKSYNYDKFRNFFDVQDKVTIDNLKKECELVLLNNR